MALKDYIEYFACIAKYDRLLTNVKTSLEFFDKEWIAVENKPSQNAFSQAKKRLDSAKAALDKFYEMDIQSDSKVEDFVKAERLQRASQLQELLAQKMKIIQDFGGFEEIQNQNEKVLECLVVEIPSLRISNVNTSAMQKLEKEIQAYNKKAEKFGYSTLLLDNETGCLNGKFTSKAKGFPDDCGFKEGMRDADIYGDFTRILKLYQELAE